MRTDFAFYVVAVVWFMVAFYFAYIPQVANYIVALFSVVFGVCFIGAGFMQRRKGTQMVSMVSAISAEKQTENPRLEATEPKTVEAKVELQTEEKTSARRVSRRRRKKSG